MKISTKFGIYTASLVIFILSGVLIVLFYPDFWYLWLVTSGFGYMIWRLEYEAIRRNKNE